VGLERFLYTIRDGALDGPTNMARDELLLHEPGVAPAVLRTYFWTPATLSLGYFQRFSDAEALPADLRMLPRVRRPTGGGAIVHDREITYALVVDATVAQARQEPLELYRLAHDAWREALADDGLVCELAADHLPLPTPRSGPFLCFERPGRGDLVMNGRKLAGSAQRRTAGRVLQHGSLLTGRGFASHPGADLGDPGPRRLLSWIERFERGVARRLGLEVRPLTWTTERLSSVEGRRQAHASPEWLQRRA
jgi:lipoate-protein ligase A